jgi:TatA/E family protein of Tat protein translocase
VLIIALLVFGPKRLPDLAKQVGRGIREFKSQIHSISEDVHSAIDRDDTEGPVTGRAEAVAKGAAAQGSDATAVVEDDDDLLAGVVVSGATGPPQPPAEH